MSSERTLEQIDADIALERAILEYEARNGRRSNGACATWRLIDALLDERLLRMVPRVPDRASGAVDGRVVHRAQGLT
jgi:hypothetical protein